MSPFPVFVVAMAGGSRRFYFVRRGLPRLVERTGMEEKLALGNEDTEKTGAQR